MDMFTMNPVERMLKLNRHLPDELRQRSVILEFLREVPERWAEHFYRIHLTGAMLRAGEDDHFQPEIFQRHRTGKQLCPTCRTTMLRTSPSEWQCVNERCAQRDGTPTKTLRHLSGPLRGVIRVYTRNVPGRPQIPAPMHFLSGFEKKTVRGHVHEIPMVKGCLLVLDRRYSPAVLTAVYRTAGELCASLREEGIEISLGV